VTGKKKTASPPRQTAGTGTVCDSSNKGGKTQDEESSSAAQQANGKSSRGRKTSQKWKHVQNSHNACSALKQVKRSGSHRPRDIIYEKGEPTSGDTYMRSPSLQLELYTSFLDVLYFT
jgi:hypothetical protein